MHFPSLVTNQSGPERPVVQRILGRRSPGKLQDVGLTGSILREPRVEPDDVANTNKGGSLDAELLGGDEPLDAFAARRRGERPHVTVRC